MHGRLDYGPNKPQEEYIRRRLDLVVGKTPYEAITLSINYPLKLKGKNKSKKDKTTKNYDRGDLTYDVQKGYLKVVPFGNEREAGGQYDFANLADFFFIKLIKVMTCCLTQDFQKWFAMKFF